MPEMEDEMPDLSMAKNFDFSKVVDKWKGYNSANDKTNVAENVYVQGSQNIYKKLSGNLAVRPGLKRVGAADSTASPVSSEFVWNTSWGATFTLAVANSKLYVIVSGVWYQLLGSLTSTRYVFDKWWDNTLKKDDCLFVNGSDDMFKWGGGFGFILSTTINTIVLDRTVVAAVLPASGSVVINGTTYTYSGSSGSTLTGVSGNPTGEANGSGVLEAVATSTNTPASGFNTDFIKVINNQVYAGSYTSRLCYISANDDYTDYVVPTPRLPGSPEFLTLDSTLNGIGVRTGKAHISIGAGEWAVVSFTDVTVGTTLTQQTTVDVKPVAKLAAAYAHEFISNVGDNLVYLSKDQQVRTFGDFNNLFVAAYPSLSQEIALELMAENFTGGGLKCIGDFTYLTAPTSGKTYLYQVRQFVDENNEVGVERLWHSPFIWNASRVDEINGTVVAFSNANPQIYEVWDTNQWHDDSPSDEPLPYSCVLALSYRGGSRRQGLWSFDKVLTTGYMTPGTPLNLQINYNYKGATNNPVVPVNSIERPTTFFGPAIGSLGDDSLGDTPLGDEVEDESESLDIQSLAQFKNISSMSLINCFEYQPIYFSDTADAQWEILGVGSNAQVEKLQDANFIINKMRN